MKIAGLQSEVMPKGNSNNIYITIQLFLPFDLRKKIIEKYSVNIAPFRGLIQLLGIH